MSAVRRSGRCGAAGYTWRSPCIQGSVCSCRRGFRSGLGLSAEDTPVVAPHLGDPLPDPAQVSAVIVTGSPAMVTDEADWSLVVERWLVDLTALQVPILGVCYGHQLLARAFGGRVADSPVGREIGSCDVKLTAEGRSHPLFDGLPETLVVQATHSQSVVELPPDAVHLAGNAHGTYQAFAIASCAVGLQFHSEFDADIIAAYVADRWDRLREEGIQPEAVRSAIRESAHGQMILANFLRACCR